MSDKYNRQAVRVRGLTPKAKLVLWVLADIIKTGREDNPELNGKAWLTQKQLAIRAEMTLPTIRSAVKELEERKLLIVDRESMGNGGRHQYYMNEQVLEEQYDFGIAQTAVLDRQAKEAEATSMKEYREAPGA